MGMMLLQLTPFYLLHASMLSQYPTSWEAQSLSDIITPFLIFIQYLMLTTIVCYELISLVRCSQQKQLPCTKVSFCIMFWTLTCYVFILDCAHHVSVFVFQDSPIKIEPTLCISIIMFPFLRQVCWLWILGAHVKYKKLKKKISSPYLYLTNQM